ncbi:MAG TPA: MMPL family transporter [Solirubrobacter sp.]|nr:MMPL family transporter [Solirubrobacter sp.]
MPHSAAGGRIARLYAWTVVALRYPIVLGWIAALAAAIALLPWLSGSSTAPLDDIVQADAQALVAQERAVKLFGSTIASDSIVVERNPNGLNRDQAEAQLRAASEPNTKGVVGAAPLFNVAVPGVKWGEQETTAITYLFLDPELNLVERNEAAHAYAATLPKPAPDTTRGVTGSGPARLAQFEEIDGILPWIEAATIAVILLVVALYFRSFGAPLVTLACAGLAYVIAVRVMAWSGERAGVVAPSEIEPVLVVLLLGLVTDYTVFFMSETRRRLAAGDSRTAAARAATARIAPLVLIAGLLVAGGAVSLLAGEMQFFRVFGPALALSALVVTLVCVTLVPALMALFGPWLFGGRTGNGRRNAVTNDDPPSNNGTRFATLRGTLKASRRVARAEGRSVAFPLLIRLLASRPGAALVALLCIAALVAAASGVRSTDLTVSFIPSLPKDSEPRQAADAAATGFVPGIVAPTEVIVEAPNVARDPQALTRLQTELAQQPGIAAVLGPAQAAEPRLRTLVVSRGQNAVRYFVLTEEEPTGAAAIDAFTNLQQRMPDLIRNANLPQATVSYAGETALAQETVDALADDLRRVGSVTAAVMLVLLAIFLRALLAPILLLFGSLLACAAAFGITAFILPGGDLVYYVPLVGAVMLVGLGSDYNVLIAGRIREEMHRRRVREAIAVAAPSASRAITVAGITLAATFALLAIVPLKPFRELALLMTLGVLIDALFVRPLLIPALIALAGRASWWPSRLRAAPPPKLIYREVRRRDAKKMTWATLTTLGERLPAREAQELQLKLPPELAEAMNGDHDQDFDSDEFVARVAERADTHHEDAARGATATLTALRNVLPEHELDYLTAALPGEYAWLFDERATGAQHDGRAPEPVIP